MMSTFCSADLWQCTFLLGCPTLMRADRGTENVLVAAVQMAFRDEHGDAFAGTKAFRYGRSTSNTVRQYRSTAQYM